MEQIVEFIERNFKEIDKWDTASATYISWAYKDKEYCVSYGNKSSQLYIFSCGDNPRYMQIAKSEKQMIKIIRKELEINEKCNC